MNEENQITKSVFNRSFDNIYNINIDMLNDISTLFIQYETSRTDIILDQLIQTRMNQTINQNGVKEKVPIPQDIRKLRKEKRKDIIKRCIEKTYSNNRLLYSEKDEYLLNVVCSCKSKYCPHCQRRHQKVTRGRLINFVEGFHTPRFCTVSLAAVTHLTAEYIRTASLQLELMRKYLKREGFTFGNYVSVLEIVLHEKYDPYYSYQYDAHGKAVKTRTGTYLRKNWNVHFHIIYDGDFIPQYLASQMLKKATKGKSKYVYFEFISNEDRSKIQNKRKALMYITKYITKQQIVTPNNERLLEYYTAIKNVKMVRVQGYKSAKKQTELVDYIKYMMKQGLCWEDASIIRNIRLEVMKDYCMKKYDINIGLEENVLLYSTDQMINYCIGI